MKPAELLQQVKYLLDCDGNKTAVQIDIELWEKLQPFVKALQSTEENPLPAKKKDELIPWEEFKVELAATGFPTEYNSPEDFIKAIKSDLARGGLHTARRLAFRGVEVYPHHEILKEYARVLAPPVVKVVPSSPEKRQAVLADREWLKKNRDNYIGRWVAIRAGELLADAASVDELVAKVGNLKGIFFTVIN